MIRHPPSRIRIGAARAVPPPRLCPYLPAGERGFIVSGAGAM